MLNTGIIGKTLDFISISQHTAPIAYIWLFLRLVKQQFISLLYQSENMSSSNINLRNPREYIFPQPMLEALETATLQTQLLIKGQGVFIFELTKTPSTTFETRINCADYSNKIRLDIKITKNEFSALLTKSDGNTFEGIERIALSTNDKAFYWLSLDSHNLVLRFGIGEARLETESCRIMFDDACKKDLLTISQFSFDDAVIAPLRMLRDPISTPVALAVKGSDDLTMDDIAAHRFMPKANLSEIGQLLYDNVAGKKFVLDDDDFPEFSQAIEYSIKTPGCWCHTKLAEKSKSKPAGQEKKIYLRITLGQNSGESPGIPYVMEIWPPGCYSSIHSHAGANAIIRVFTGSVAVTMYPFLGTEESFGKATFKAGDIAWISPTLNQYHMLKNENLDGPTCITIQCYMYDKDDLGHYSYFDYLDDNNKLAQFNPNSDMDFVEFKATMRKEWAKR